MTAWLLTRLARWLFGPSWPYNEELLDGITLAIQEEAERMGLRGPCA